MPHVLSQLQLKYDFASVPRFVEIVSNARKGFATAGWELVGSWATSVGAVVETERTRLLTKLISTHPSAISG
jgi:hypothetical protein